MLSNMRRSKKITRIPRRAYEIIRGRVRYGLETRGLVEKYDYIPSILYLEVTNKCNANCVFCRRSDTHKPLMHMDFEMFKAIVDAAPYTTQVHTQGFGEPLLYPHLIDAIKYCKDRGKRVVFYTNASLLDNDGMIFGLLDTFVDQIRFSVDEITPELYEPLRRGLKFDKVLYNIERFKYCKEAGNYPTETVARICETKENKSRMKEIVEFWSKRVDIVVVNPEIDIPSFAENAEEPFVSFEGHIECPNVYEQFAVRSNGDVVLCCTDWFHNYVIDNIAEGPITKERILDIFNSQKYNELRLGMATGIDCPTRCLSCKGIKPPVRD